MSMVLRNSTRALARSRLNTVQQISRRYASENVHKSDSTRNIDSNPAANSNRALFAGLAVVFACIPGYYFFHANRAPGVGQATIKEKRRSGEQPAETEHRDPRDSGVKSLEDKKAKEAGKAIR